MADTKAALDRAALDRATRLKRAGRTFVIPEKKLLYVSLAKNACTSLKWLMAEISGEELDRFQLGHGTAVTAAGAIHHRDAWKKTPRWNELEPEIRAQIRPDNGWFVFSVVRDPRVRMFSAWESKFLLRNPQHARFRDEPWYPRIPTDPTEVVEDFAKFVTMLDTSPDHVLHRDSHFSTQTRLLAEHLVTYSQIYDISEIPDLKTDLTAHLRAQGDSHEVSLRHDNDTPLVANPRVFEGDVLAAVERIYATDLERFGHLWDFDKLKRKSEWSEEAMHHAQAVALMGDRITGLREDSARQQRQIAKLRRDLGKADARIESLRTRVPTRPAVSPPSPLWRRTGSRVAGVVRVVRQRVGR